MVPNLSTEDDKDILSIFVVVNSSLRPNCTQELATVGTQRTVYILTRAFLVCFVAHMKHSVDLTTFTVKQDQFAVVYQKTCRYKYADPYDGLTH